DNPQILPGGEHVMFTIASGSAADRWDRAQIVVQSLKSGERKVIVDGGSDGRYLNSGHVIYAKAGIEFAVPFDLKRLSVTGGAVPIVEGVRGAGGANTGAAHLSVSDTGTLVYVPGPATTSNAASDLALIDRAGVVTRLNLPAAGYETPRLSPDGRTLAFGIDEGKHADSWVYDLKAVSAPRRLTFVGKNRNPVWSPDGRWLAVSSDRDGDPAIFRVRSDGTGVSERLTKAEAHTSHAPE